MNTLFFVAYCLKRNKSISNISLVILKVSNVKDRRQQEKRKGNKEHGQTTDYNKNLMNYMELQYKLFLFIASHTLLQSHAEFNKLL